MNNLYNVSKDLPGLSADQTAMFENTYHPGRMARSQTLDLDDLDGKNRFEFRCHKRFQLDKDAFAVIRSKSAGPIQISGKSMGGIACAVFNANPSKLGKIDNISMGGLLFHHVDYKVKLSQSFVLDILMADCGFYLANLPFKIITDVAVPDEVYSDAIEWRQVRIQFLKLNTLQLAKLNTFILSRGIF